MRDEIVQLVLGGRQAAAIAEVEQTLGPVSAEAKEPVSVIESDVQPPEYLTTDLPLPSIGVEIISAEERQGARYFTIRDLRNGSTVQNVTAASARKLWSYAITQHLTHPVDPAAVTWRGDFGLWKAERRAKKLRYDLALRQPEAPGGMRVFYGVTEDGMTGPWAQFLKAEVKNVVDVEDDDETEDEVVIETGDVKAKAKPRRRRPRGGVRRDSQDAAETKVEAEAGRALRSSPHLRSRRRHRQRSSPRRQAGSGNLRPRLRLRLRSRRRLRLKFRRRLRLRFRSRPPYRKPFRPRQNQRRAAGGRRSPRSRIRLRLRSRLRLRLRPRPRRRTLFRLKRSPSRARAAGNRKRSRKPNHRAWVLHPDRIRQSPCSLSTGAFFMLGVNQRSSHAASGAVVMLSGLESQGASRRNLSEASRPASETLVLKMAAFESRPRGCRCRGPQPDEAISIAWQGIASGYATPRNDISCRRGRGAVPRHVNFASVRGHRGCAVNPLRVTAGAIFGTRLDGFHCFT